MSRRSLINIALFVLAALLGLLIWRLQPEAPPGLTDLRPEQVYRIQITDRSGGEILLTRQNGAWMLGETSADAERIEQLLGICSTPSLKHFPAPQGDLQQFGLAPPAILLRLNDLELAFGSNDPLNGWRYVQITDRIHLIGDGFHHHLSAASSEFIKAE
ncbi:MAG: hypothetical protein ABFS39_10620 [Pseudomonadota bacterium]